MQRSLLACEQAPSARPLPRAGAGSSDDDTDSDKDWQASSQDSAELDQQEFEPDEILAEAYDSSTGKRIYYLRWKSTEPGVDANRHCCHGPGVRLRSVSPPPQDHWQGITGHRCGRRYLRHS